jgi:uncharacterized protein
MKKLFLSGTFLIVIVAIIGLTSCASLPALLAPVASSNNTAANTNSVIYSNQQMGIWVAGSGSVTVTPDIVNLNLGVRSQETTVGAAQAKAATAMSQIMNVLKANNIADKDIQTVQFNINPVYNYDNKTMQSIVIGYSVNNIVNVKIRNLNNVGKIIDAVADAGGNLTVINSISFAVDNPEQYYTEARQKAMNDAQTKAQQLATLGGITLGKPIYISENSVSSNQSVYYDAREASGASVPTTAISAGEAEITVNVQVVYSIG